MDETRRRVSSGTASSRAAATGEYDETLEGYVVDIACVRKFARNALAERAREHTRECALMGHCVESGYALVTAEGEVSILDSKATPLVVDAVNKGDGRPRHSLTRGSPFQRRRDAHGPGARHRVRGRAATKGTVVHTPLTTEEAQRSTTSRNCLAVLAFATGQSAPDSSVLLGQSPNRDARPLLCACQTCAAPAAG